MTLKNIHEYADIMRKRYLKRLQPFIPEMIQVPARKGVPMANENVTFLAIQLIIGLGS